MEVWVCSKLECSDRMNSAVERKCTMGLLLVVLFFIGLIMMISNQYAMIKKMDEMNETLSEINNKLG
jgi:preprotein translocase subunit YajC